MDGLAFVPRNPRTRVGCDARREMADMVRKMLLGALALLALTAAPAAAQYRFVVGPGQVTVVIADS